MKHLLPSLVVILLVGCQTKLANDSVGFDTYQLYDYYCDELGNEGIVAWKERYDDGPEFVAVISGDETDCIWGPEDRNVIPFNEYANVSFLYNPVYAIQMNQAVERLGAASYPAFQWCHSKNATGERIHASSWILPSQMMMDDILEENYRAIDNALTQYGMTPLSQSGYYWTCTEDIEGFFRFADDEYTYAYGFDPVSRAIPITFNARYPVWKTDWQKSLSYHVRAIKIIHYYYPDTDD